MRTESSSEMSSREKSTTGTTTLLASAGSLLSVSLIRPLLALAGLASVGALCTGCGVSRDLKHSMTAYEAGNFHRAQDACEAIEDADLDGKRQVRYLVYCGLAYYKTGQHDTAREMLTSGQKLYTSGDPAWLKPIIVDEMNKAMVDLAGGARPGAPPVSLTSQGVSSADYQ